MYIRSISLQNFRNIEKLNMELTDGINIFHGENAQGKTNFLESIYLCAMGRSMRPGKDIRLVSFGEKEGHIRLEAMGENGTDRIDIHLLENGKKGIAVNGLPLKKIGDLFGILYVVIFSPEDLNLVKDGPAQRRRFLDMELCQLSRVYYYDLQQYYRILKQRNHLLKELQRENSQLETLCIWDHQLVEYGKRVIAARRNFVAKLDQLSSRKEKRLTDGVDTLQVVYHANCAEENLQEKLEKNIQRDILLGATQNGPHKDDLIFLVNGLDVKQYGSQGQQRTTALALRLAEVDLIRMEKGVSPILLLDDVLSELDRKRQKCLMESIADLQVIITCTGLEDAIRSHIGRENLFRVSNGVIQREKK